MKLKHDKTEDTGANYYFILGCLGALTAAALLTAGAIALFAAKAGAATALTTAAFATTATVMTASASIVPILAPIFGAIILIAAICALPFLFSGDPSPYVPTTIVTTPGYRSNWGSPLFFSHHHPSTVVTTGGYDHHHHGGIFGNTGHHHGHVPSSGVNNHHHGHSDVHIGGNPMHGHH